jgi:hypothetical protein
MADTPAPEEHAAMPVPEQVRVSPQALARAAEMAEEIAGLREMPGPAPVETRGASHG